MTQQKFRSLPLREQPNRVDREERVIYGVSAAQAVEALGHGIELDAKSLEQIAELGNKSKNGVGIKSRYTHPGLSSDGMGKQLGRMKNFRVEGDKVVGDLHLLKAASHAPDGDLAGHVMDLAEEDSAAFGMSIVAQGTTVWTLDDGTEKSAKAYWDDHDEEDSSRPKNALTKFPVLRLTALDAVDVVDEPAANRDGMFSAHLWGTNVKAESMFGEFDGFLAQLGMTPTQAWGYALKYFDARGALSKGINMTENSEAVLDEQNDEIVVAVEIVNEGSDESQGDDEVKQEEFQILQAKFEALEAEKLAEQKKSAALAATVETMQKEARAARFKDLATGWHGEIAAHMTVLEALGEGSEAYGAYCKLQSALSEQIEQGGLYKELGGNPKTDSGATATERINKLAMARAKEANVPFATALSQIMSEQPALYGEYVAEAEVKVG